MELGEGSLATLSPSSRICLLIRNEASTQHRKELRMSYPEHHYHGDKGEISAVYRSSDLEPDLTIGSSSVLRYLATGGSTHGQFGLYRWDFGPRPAGPRAHFHRSIQGSIAIGEYVGTTPNDAGLACSAATQSRTWRLGGDDVDTTNDRRHTARIHQNSPRRSAVSRCGRQAFQ